MNLGKLKLEDIKKLRSEGEAAKKKNKDASAKLDDLKKKIEDAQKQLANDKIFSTIDE